MLLRSRRERFTLLTLSLKICLLKIPHPSYPSIPESNSHSRTSPLPKRPNPEKPKPPKTRTQTKKVVIGHLTKTNDIIGSLSYIINTSLTNTSEGQIGSSNLWPPLLKQGRPNSADRTIKRWKKNTSISPKYL